MRKRNDGEGGPSRADGIKVPKKEDHVDLPRQTGGSAMKLTPVGIDIAKSVFQVHHVDEETGEVLNKPIKRAKCSGLMNPDTDLVILPRFHVQHVMQQRAGFRIRRECSSRSTCACAVDCNSLRSSRRCPGAPERGFRSVFGKCVRPSGF